MFMNIFFQIIIIKQLQHHFKELPHETKLPSPTHSKKKKN